MTRTGSYSSEVLERAVRMVFEVERECSLQWSATVSIADKTDS